MYILHARICVLRYIISFSPRVSFCLFIELVIIRGGHPRTYNNNKYTYTYTHCTTRSPSSVSMNILPALLVAVVVYASIEYIHRYTWLGTLCVCGGEKERECMLIIIHVYYTYIPFVFDYGGSFFSSTYIDTPYTCCCCRAVAAPLPAHILLLTSAAEGNHFSFLSHSTAYII